MTMVLAIATLIIKRQWVVQALQDLLEWVQEHPTGGPFAISCGYIVCELFFVPGSILTIGSGFALKQAYGSTWKAWSIGVIAVFVGAYISAIICMLLGRFVFRELAQKLANKYPMVEALDKALETEGLKLMLLMRLCPLIPFSPLNYIMGITSVSFRDYCIGLVSITPATCVYVFIGTTLSSLYEAIHG